MINRLIGIPSYETEILNKILKKTVDLSSEEFAYSFKDLTTAYVRGSKKKPSEKLQKIIDENKIDVSLELAKAYVSDLEIASHIFNDEDVFHQPEYKSNFSSLSKAAEKNEKSLVIQNFSVNMDCNFIIEEHEKFYKYLHFVSLKKDIKILEKEMRKYWNSGLALDTFTTWIKLEFYGMKCFYKKALIKDPMDLKILQDLVKNDKSQLY